MRQKLTSIRLGSRRRWLSAFAIASMPFFSCDRSPKVSDPSSAIMLSPRLDRTARLTDSIWNLAAVVHVNLVTTDGRLLLDDTVLFSNHRSPTVKGPIDQGMVMRIEGLDNHLVLVWSGKETLPPSARDTAFLFTVDAVAAQGSAGSNPNGSANPPSLDSVDAISWTTGTYDKPLHLFLSCITPGAKIHYTLDGTYPTATSPVYVDTGIQIDSSRTLEAITIAPGWVNSEVLVQRFTLQARPASLDSSSASAWAADTFDQVLTLNLSSPTPNAEIRYTLDGSVPSRSSPAYKGGLTIDSSCTLNATAYAGKLAPSAPMPSKRITLQAQPVTQTSFSYYQWSTDTYDQPVILKLVTKSAKAEIHYTRDGTAPTRSSPIYKDSLLVDSGCNLAAAAFVGKSLASTPVFKKTFVLQAQPVTLASATTYGWTTDTYDRPVVLQLTTKSANAEIHYTLDGTTPTRSSPIFVNSLTVDSACSLGAVAFFGKSTASAPVFKQSFRFQPMSPYVTAVSTPAWTTDTYDRPVDVTLASSTPNAEIHYTLDGSIPTKASALFTKAVPIDSNRTLKAIAYAAISPIGSPVSSQSFHFQVQSVWIGADQNIGWPPFRIGMSCPTPGTTIRYARHGHLPTADSTLYTDSLLFSKTDDSASYTAFAYDPAHPKIAASSTTTAIFRARHYWDRSLPYRDLVDVRDGHTYKILDMGSQTWMAENLDYAPAGGNFSCVSYTDYSDCPSSGRVYDWATVMRIDPAFDSSAYNGSDAGQQGICPVGWHVPSIAEWTKLTDTIIGSSTAVARLHNDLRMDAHPQSFNLGAVFWSATEQDSVAAHEFYGGDSYNPYYLTWSPLKSSKLQVRCIKN
jgi:hypothetical protein